LARGKFYLVGWDHRLRWQGRFLLEAASCDILDDLLVVVLSLRESLQDLLRIFALTRSQWSLLENA